MSIIVNFGISAAFIDSFHGDDISVYILYKRILNDN